MSGAILRSGATVLPTSSGPSSKSIVIHVLLLYARATRNGFMTYSGGTAGGTRGSRPARIVPVKPCQPVLRFWLRASRYASTSVPDSRAASRSRLNRV